MLFTRALFHCLWRLHTKLFQKLKGINRRENHFLTNLGTQAMEFRSCKGFGTSSIVKVKWAFTLSISASLFFTCFVYLSHYTWRMLQNIFSYVSRNLNFGEWSTNLEFVSGKFTFNYFYAENLEKMLHGNGARKGCGGNFYFLLISKVVTLLVKRMHFTLKD